MKKSMLHFVSKVVVMIAFIFVGALLSYNFGWLHWSVVCWYVLMTAYIVLVLLRQRRHDVVRVWYPAKFWIVMGVGLAAIIVLIVLMTKFGGITRTVLFLLAGLIAIVSLIVLGILERRIQNDNID